MPYADPADRRRYNKEYWARNKEKTSAAHRQWVSQNRNKTRAYVSKWGAANKEQTNRRRRERFGEEPYLRAADNMRRRLRRYVAGAAKFGEIDNIFGCSATELRDHLEKQFKPGMTWDNYGKEGWHIDHIRPCKSFDLSDPAQRIAAFHYSNLQPLWAADNWQKGAKEDGSQELSH